MFIVSLVVLDFFVGGVFMFIWIYFMFVNYLENLSGFFEFFGSFDWFSVLVFIFYLIVILGERYLVIIRLFVYEIFLFCVYKWMIMVVWVIVGLLMGFFGFCILF